MKRKISLKIIEVDQVSEKLVLINFNDDTYMSYSVAELATFIHAVPLEKAKMLK